MTVMKTQSSGHAIELTRNALRDGHRCIIAVGGDGTLNEVVNGVLSEDEDGQGLTIGLIPQGTGSDFRRAVHLPLDEVRAIDTIRRGRTRKLDAMRVVYRHPDGTDATRYAINLTSFGMGGAVAARANRSPKPLGGTVTFLVATALTTLRFNGNHVLIRMDDGELQDEWITNVAVGNGQYHGAGMRVCPEAIMDDGILDVTLIEKLSLWEIAWSIRLLFNGQIYDHPKVRFRRARKVVATSEELATIEIDGEPLGHLPLEVTVLPSAIRMIVP